MFSLPWVCASGNGTDDNNNNDCQDDKGNAHSNVRGGNSTETDDLFFLLFSLFPSNLMHGAHDPPYCAG